MEKVLFMSGRVETVGPKVIRVVVTDMRRVYIPCQLVVLQSRVPFHGMVKCVLPLWPSRIQVEPTLIKKL